MKTLIYKPDYFPVIQNVNKLIKKYNKAGEINNQNENDKVHFSVNIS